MSDPEKENRMSEPKTVAEALDAAATPEEFGSVLQGLFRTLEKAKDEED